MKKSWLTILSLGLPIFVATPILVTYTTANKDNHNVDKIDINSIFTSDLDMNGFYENYQPKDDDIIAFLYGKVKGGQNEHVINDLVVGDRTRNGQLYDVEVDTKNTSKEYEGSIVVTYSITNKIDLANLANTNVDINGLLGIPSNAQILNRLKALNSGLDINQLDFNTAATKTIGTNQAYSYELIPRVGFSYYSGSCKLIVYKTGSTISLSSLIQNTYLSIFTGTPGTDEPLFSTVRSTIKFWNDTLVTNEVADSLTSNISSQEKIYKYTQYITSTLDFITGTVACWYFVIPQDKYIYRDSESADWTLATPSATMNLNSNTTRDCFINSSITNSFTQVGAKTSLKICDLTHTSVYKGNIGYNNGSPTQTDDGFTTCLYSLNQPQLTTESFHNHMNRSMKNVYLMNSSSVNERIMVFGDANLTDIWCKKMSGTLQVSCYPANDSRPPCNVSYNIHLPYGSSCSGTGVVTRPYTSGRTGTGSTSDWNYMKLWRAVDSTKYYPNYSDSNQTIYDDVQVIFNIIYDF